MTENNYYIDNIKEVLQKDFRQLFTNLNSNCLNTLSFELDKDKTLYIYFPHQFFSDWFSTNIKQDFESLIYDKYPSIGGIRYKLSPVLNHSYLSLHQYHYDSNYLFEEFLYNWKNKNTYISACQYVEQGLNITPFLLCGDKGSGKSHLIKSMANKYIQLNYKNNILYLPFQEFTYLYSSSISMRKEIRKQLAAFDILIIEDIHLLSNQAFIQEEFIYLYEYLYEHGVLMLFTCLGKISSIFCLDKNLLSRIESGLMLYLQKPDLDIRLEYIKRKSDLNNLCLEKKDILNIGQQAGNFKELNSLLNNIFYKLDTDQNNNNEIGRIISEIKSQHEPNLTFEYILNIIANQFQIKDSEILSKKRTRDTVLARQMGMYLCRLLLKFSYSYIGSLFGGRDHSTVIYSIDKVQKLQNNNPEIDKLLTNLVNLCQKR